MLKTSPSQTKEYKHAYYLKNKHKKRPRLYPKSVNLYRPTPNPFELKSWEIDAVKRKHRALIAKILEMILI